MNIQLYNISNTFPVIHKFSDLLKTNELDFHIKYLLNTDKESYSFIEKIVYDIAVYHCQKDNKQVNDVFVEFYFENPGDTVLCQYKNKNKNNLILSCMTLFNDVFDNERDSELEVENIFTNISHNEYKYKLYDNDDTNTINDINMLKLAYLNKNNHIVFDGKKMQCYKTSHIRHVSQNGFILFVNLWENNNIGKCYENKLSEIMYDKTNQHIFFDIYQYCKKKPVFVENIINADFYENLLYKKKIDEMLYFIHLLFDENIVVKDGIIEILDTYNINRKQKINNILKDKIGNLIEDIENTNKGEFTINNRFLQRFQHRKIFNSNICDWFIDEAEKYAANNGGWTSENFINHTTLDIKIQNIRPIFEYFFKVEISNILKIIQKDYCLSENTKINIKDLNIIKYKTGIQEGIDFHKDSSFLTFNICLNDNFEGGGTLFEDNLMMEIEKGDMIVHCGKITHKGLSITKGERYILLGFLEIILDVSIEIKN